MSLRHVAAKKSRSPRRRRTGGAPPTFGTAPGSGPTSRRNIRRSGEARAGDDDAGGTRDGGESWRRTMAGFSSDAWSAKSGARPSSPRRRAGIRRSPGEHRADARSIRSERDGERAASVDGRRIAFAPVTRLSRWIEQRKLTSERLTTSISTASRSSTASCAR